MSDLPPIHTTVPPSPPPVCPLCGHELSREIIPTTRVRHWFCWTCLKFPLPEAHPGFPNNP